jgi:hypothetical protein
LKFTRCGASFIGFETFDQSLRQKHDMERWKRRLLGLLIILTIASCTPPSVSKLAQMPNRHFYITSGADIPGQCYHILGEVQFQEAYADAVVDTNGSIMRRRIKEAAEAKYPNKVGGVVDLHSRQNVIGTTVTVSGEAVELDNQPSITCALQKIY